MKTTAICLPILLIVLVSAACTASKPRNSVNTLNPGTASGIFEGLLPSPDSPGRKVILDLRPDSTATLSFDEAGKGRPMEQGRWSSLPPQVRFDFLPVSGHRQESITWTISDDELIPLIWNKDAYGPLGLRLRRRR